MLFKTYLSIMFRVLSCIQGSTCIIDSLVFYENVFVCFFFLLTETRNKYVLLTGPWVGLEVKGIIVILHTEKKTLFIYGFQHHGSVILAVVHWYTCTIIAWLRYNITYRKDSLQNTPHCYIERKHKVTNQWIYQYDTWESYNYRGVISDVNLPIR